MKEKIIDFIRFSVMETLWPIMFFCLIIGGVYFSINSVLYNDPQICIDNYSRYPVKIYLNNEFWMDVNSSVNLNINSANNEFHEVDEGNYFISIKDTYGVVVLEEYEIQVKDGEYYILNILGIVTYEDGYAAYGKGYSSASNHSKRFFNAGSEYHFKSPPTSITSRSKYNNSRSYIKRININ